MPNLLWKDIKETTNKIFDIWVGNPELLWAHDAWQKITEQGLASYENELEKQIVLMRLFALGTLYHEFCQVAFGENSYVDYVWWIEALSKDDFFLSSFRLGQLIGSNYRANEEILDEDHEHKFVTQTIISLVEQQRKVIVSALLKGYGSSSVLFATLFLSNRFLPEFDEVGNDIFDVDALDDVLNTDITSNKIDSLYWIDDGMPSLQDYEFYPHGQSKCESVKNVIAKGESATVEFKVGLCLNPHTHKKDESMIENVLKTIAAFINSDGGVLLIGVHDNGNIEGINGEYPITNPKKNSKDGFELFLADILKNRIEYGLIHVVCKSTICDQIEAGKDVCEVQVLKSPTPEIAYVNNKVFVRQLNRSIELNGKEFASYMNMRSMILS